VGGAGEQPTLGFLAGLAIGVALSLLIWWNGRSGTARR
jgi:hypothetical protein